MGAPSRLCAVHACVSDVRNLGVALARLSEAVVCLQALLKWHMWLVDMPLPMVTFDLYYALPSVNEHEDPDAIVGSFQAGGLPVCV